MISDISVLEEVDKITRSGALGVADGTLPNLLRYLVEEELAGRGDRLKAYSIALDVLKKDDDFDPSKDSSVRVLMHRLRIALSLYYASPSTVEDVIVIEFPKLQYRPHFEIRRARIDDNPSPSGEGSEHSDYTAKTARRRKAILPIILGAMVVIMIAAIAYVGGFVSTSRQVAQLSPSVAIILDGEDADYGSISRVKALLLQRHTGRFPVVIGRDDASDYQLRLSSAKIDGQPKALALLYDSDQRLLVSQYFDAGSLDKPVAWSSISDEIDRAFLAQDGYLANHFVSKPEASLPRKRLYQCVNDAQRSSARPGSSERDRVSEFECLDADLLADPEDKVFVLLQRGRLEVRAAAKLDRAERVEALNAARQYLAEARKLSDDDDLLLRNEIWLEWHAPDRDDDRLRELLRSAQQLDMSPALRLMTATSYSYFLSDWERARKVAGRFLTAPDSSKTLVDLPFHYIVLPELFVSGQYERARQQLAATRTSSHPTFALFTLAIGCAEGDPSVISRGRALVDKNPDLTLGSLGEEIERRQYAANLQLALLAALSKPQCDFVADL